MSNPTNITSESYFKSFISTSSSFAAIYIYTTSLSAHLPIFNALAAELSIEGQLTFASADFADIAGLADELLEMVVDNSDDDDDDDVPELPALVVYRDGKQVDWSTVVLPDSLRSRAEHWHEKAKEAKEAKTA